MIADLKRTVLLYPHLYQAKQQLLFFLLFAMLGVANIRDNYNGADLMMPVFLWSFFALMPSTNLVRLDYAAHTSTSPHRKRMMTVIPALILFVLQIVMWCMVVLVAVITGRSADLSGANAVMLLALHFASILLGSLVESLSAKFPRMVSVAVMVVIVVMLMTFMGSLTISGGPLVQSGASWLFTVSAGITPPVTIAISAALAVINAAILYLLLRVMYKYPIRREYLERLKG